MTLSELKDENFQSIEKISINGYFFYAGFFISSNVTKYNGMSGKHGPAIREESKDFVLATRASHHLLILSSSEFLRF